MNNNVSSVQREGLRRGCFRANNNDNNDNVDDKDEDKQRKKKIG